MPTPLLSHLRRNAVAYLALMIALGGTSYAAVALPKNSVGTKQLRANAVRSPQVKDGTLRLQDFAKGQIPKGDAGPPGPTGPTGPTWAAYSATADSAPTEYPATTPGAPTVVTTFTQPAAGDLYVFASLNVFPACGAASAPTLGLYVDTAPVPGTRRRPPDGTTTTLTMQGVLADVPAGTHTLQVTGRCDGYTRGPLTQSASAVTGGAILIGG